MRSALARSPADGSAPSGSGREKAEAASPHSSARRISVIAAAARSVQSVVVGPDRLAVASIVKGGQAGRVVGVGSTGVGQHARQAGTNFRADRLRWRGRTGAGGAVGRRAGRLELDVLGLRLGGRALRRWWFGRGVFRRRRVPVERRGEWTWRTPRLRHRRRGHDRHQ